jgi:hypothetical protein
VRTLRAAPLVGSEGPHQVGVEAVDAEDDEASGGHGMEG